MIDGPSLVTALKECGVTHVVWIPDTELGAWDEALRADPDLQLIRVCREGEAISIAAGLLLGLKRPVVLIQCTGMFEAGDALRNVVHDLKLPLFLVIGLRGYTAHQRGSTVDTCPLFAEPILKAWKIPYAMLEKNHQAADVAAAYRQCRSENRARALLLVE